VRACRQPVLSSSDANARRIVAYGLRNPFRFTQRPGTDELWIGDVGWNTWEEINRVVPPSGDRVELRLARVMRSVATSGYQGAGLNLCSSLYSTHRFGHQRRTTPTTTAPAW
jgi:hypothetical protein